MNSKAQTAATARRKPAVCPPQAINPQPIPRQANDQRKAAQRKAALKARSGIKAAKPAPQVTEPDYPIGKGRKSLKGIAIYMHPLAKDQLARIARDHQRTVQELGLEALNLLFLHYGEKPIA